MPVPSGSSPTERQVQAQLAAMRSASFELLLLDFDDDSKASLFTSTAEGVMRRLPWLRAQNAKGININVRPVGSHLSLLDDLTFPQTEELSAQGFEPCAIVETSARNYQAWLDHGRDLTANEATAAARMLADRFGSDKGAAGRRHAGRLAGFTNRKESRRLANGLFPFVRLTNSGSRVYTASSAFLSQVGSAVAVTTKPYLPKPFIPEKNRALLTIDRFHADARYGGDLSRADFGYAIYATSHGISDCDIEAAILQRDMSKKGNRLAQVRYAKYTVRRAKKSVSN